MSHLTRKNNIFRQFPPDVISPYVQNREMELSEEKPHPQDMAIVMKFINSK